MHICSKVYLKSYPLFACPNLANKGECNSLKCCEMILMHAYMVVFEPQNASYLGRDDPDLPICAEQTVLVWIPLGFMWLCAPWNLMPLCRRSQVNKKSWTKLYFCKQVLHN